MSEKQLIKEKKTGQLFTYRGSDTYNNEKLHVFERSDVGGVVRIVNREQGLKEFENTNLRHCR